MVTLNSMKCIVPIGDMKIEQIMFVDTGISVLVERLAAQENVDTKKDWIVKAAGCGNPMGLKEVFKIRRAQLSYAA